MNPSINLMDDFWLDEPSEVGQTQFTYGEVEGVPYTVALQAGLTERRDIGWIRISGIAVGQFGSHDPESAWADRQVQFIYTEAFTDLRPLFGRVAASAESDLRAFEDTRRIRRDLDEKKLRPSFESGKRVTASRKSEELKVVATIYNLVKNSYGLRNTSHYISGYLGCSLRTAEERVREAKRRGLIESSEVHDVAQVGAVTKRF